MAMMLDEEQRALTRDFWSQLAKTRTVMLGSTHAAKVAARPMTAQLDDEAQDEDGASPIYFFASRGEGIGADVLAGRGGAVMTFVSKNHDLLASAEGQLTIIQDTALIDRLWSVFASLYYDGGKRDPDLLLLRLDAQQADVWRSTTSGFLKSVAYRLIGRDAVEAAPEDRGVIAL